MDFWVAVVFQHRFHLKVKTRIVVHGEAICDCTSFRSFRTT